MKSLTVCALAGALVLVCAAPAPAGTITAYYSALGGTPFESVAVVYNGNPYTLNATTHRVN